MSDEAERRLLDAARGGDGRAFDALLGPLVEPAYRLACGMLLDRQEAEDAVQEAALRAWRKLGNVRPGADLKPWFFAIVANHCRGVRRARWWSVLRGLEVELGSEEWAAPDGRIDIARALVGLSPRDRALVTLHYFHDLPLEEAGAVVGLTPAAAKSRLYRALKRLRPALERKEAYVDG
jgi:RNA polymerase sigma-70 factor (ECF subfamily)